MTSFHWTALFIIAGLISASVALLALVLFLGPPDGFDIELETEKLENSKQTGIGTRTWR
jgi:hypothetical protein